MLGILALLAGVAGLAAAPKAIGAFNRRFDAAALASKDINVSAGSPAIDRALFRAWPPDPGRLFGFHRRVWLPAVALASVGVSGLLVSGAIDPVIVTGCKTEVAALRSAARDRGVSLWALRGSPEWWAIVHCLHPEQEPLPEGRTAPVS